MNESFLFKEQELIKLNKELDLKNKILQNNSKKQKHTECSLKRSDKFHVTDKKQPVSNSKVDKENIESEQQFVHTNVEPSSSGIAKIPPKSKATKCSPPQQQSNPIIPEKLVKRNISSEGLIKFLKSKVTVLQDELDKINKDFTKKCEELHVCVEIQKQIEIQRDQVIGRNNNITAQLSKVEDKLTESELRLKEREVELVCLRKELEALKREYKSTSHANISLERRLSKTQEDLENMKNCLSGAQQVERETREKTKHDHDMLDKEIKMLRKQRVDLITAYKKQMMLIDNLKRQNLCLEQAKLIDFAEKEFIKILDWHNA